MFYYTNKVLTVVAALMFAAARIVLFSLSLLTCLYLVLGIPTFAILDWTGFVEIGAGTSALIWAMSVVGLLASIDLLREAGKAWPEYVDFARAEWDRPRPMQYVR